MAVVVEIEPGVQFTNRWRRYLKHSRFADGEKIGERNAVAPGGVAGRVAVNACVCAEQDGAAGHVTRAVAEAHARVRRVRRVPIIMNAFRQAHELYVVQLAHAPIWVA